MTAAGPQPDQDEQPGGLFGQGGPPPIPVLATLGEAWRVVRDNPRTTLLPLAVVAIPISVIATVVTTTLFLTAWSDEEVANAATFTTETPRMILFALVVIAGIEAMFGQVARAATVVAIGGTVEDRRPSLTEALDPAFTRIGGLLAIFVVMLALVAVAAATVVGIVLLPYFLGRLGVALEAYMLEGHGPLAAMGRSWGLMRGRLIRFLGLMLLAVGCVLPVLLVLSLATELFGDGRTTELLLVGALSIVQGVVLVPVVAFLTACTTLYYLKARELEHGAGRA